MWSPTGCGRTRRFDCIFRVQTAFGRAPCGSIVVNNHQILGFFLWGGGGGGALYTERPLYDVTCKGSQRNVLAIKGLFPRENFI